MNKYTTLFLMMAFTLALVQSATAGLPFNENTNGYLRTVAVGEGWSQTTSPYGEFADHYIPLWGYYPNAVLWQDVGLDSLNFSATLYVQPKPYKTLADWNPVPTWDDVRPHMMILVQDVVTLNSDTIKAETLSDNGALVFSNPTAIDNSQRNCYVAGIREGNAFNLPMPLEDRIYRVWTEIWEIPDDKVSKMNSIQSDTTYLVRAKVSTATDSLMWSKPMGFEANPTELAYMKEVLKLWPEDTRTLKKLLDYYFITTPDCDSLQYYGARFIAVAATDPTYFMMSGMTWEQYLERAVEEVCGE
jgi:hypothetical protein